MAVATLNAELIRTGQVLKIPVYIPPEGPPGPHPAPHHGGTGYSCSSATFKKCLGSTCSLGGAGCYNSSGGCGAGCPPLAADAWLANEGSRGGFALVKQQGSMAIKSTSAQSWLKKSKAHASSLPPTQKRLVPQGTILPIVERPLSEDSYWLVTLKETVPPNNGARIFGRGKS